MYPIVTLNIIQLSALFYFSYMRLYGLFLFLLGIPFGLLIVDTKPKRKVVYVNIIIGMLNLFPTVYASYWYVFIFEGIIQTIIMWDVLM